MSWKKNSAYFGVNAIDPPNFTRNSSSPTADDFLNFTVGALWLDDSKIYGSPPAAPDIEDVYVLLQKSGDRCVWDNFALNPLLTITGDIGGAINPNEAGNVNLLGTVNLVSVTGDPATYTLTLDLDDSIARTYSTAAGDAVPAGHTLAFIDGVAITMAGATNQTTVSLDGTVATSYTTDAGTATPVAHALNIFGDGGNISTAAGGATVTVDSNEGVILRQIVSDAGTATVAAGSFNIIGGMNVSTVGAGNTLTVSSARFGSQSFCAGLSANVQNVTGFSLIYRILFDHVYFDDAGFPAIARVTFSITTSYTFTQEGWNAMRNNILNGGIASVAASTLIVGAGNLAIAKDAIVKDLYL